MNSMYGRFGMNTDLLKHAIMNTDQLTKLSYLYLIQSICSIGGLNLVSYTLSKTPLKTGSKADSKLVQKFLEGLTRNTNVAIAAAVTAHSRMLINQFKLEAMRLGLDVYYSDTDSLVLNGPLPDGLVDKSVLGKLKLEHTLKEGLFIMPKVYYLETLEGEVISKC